MSGSKSTFAKGAALVIRALLQSPNFLYRTELGPTGKPLSGYEAAVHEDAPGSARSAALPWMQADITRAGQDLGWRPSRDLKASVSDLWEAACGAP